MSIFKPTVKKTLPGELRGARFHDLRHTHAALLIAQGAHTKAIQYRLGHSSITVTLDRYGHLFPALDDALTDALDATYRAADDPGDEADHRSRPSDRPRPPSRAGRVVVGAPPTESGGVDPIVLNCTDAGAESGIRTRDLRFTRPIEGVSEIPPI
ncbi:MAG TPA: tyrosine-type recombinase/integrase, partial [Euzebyales bacterium]|nr:tyrosine-type recombinase/integrase [Euzebyales bacterium]